ncbi:MAG: calcium-binding protein, partial [Prochlorococcus sp.]
VIGIDDSYAGKVVANFSAAYVSSDATVDATAKVGGSTSTIGENAPAGSVAGVNLYVNTGTGADEIGGSDKNDFVRAGAGDDEVNAGSGDDIVRLGVGSDKASLGGGDDSLYMTVDQFGDGNVNTVTDFDSSGDDKLLFNNDIKDLLTITGQGTNTLTLTLSGDNASTVTFTSEGGTFDTDDIEFV